MEKLAERIKIAVAALIAVGGLAAFYALTDRQPLVIRLAALLGAFAAAAGVMWFTEMGRTFLTEVRNELKRVTWPSQKEVYATTIMVILTSIFFGVFLWVVDLALTAAVGWIFHRFGA